MEMALLGTAGRAAGERNLRPGRLVGAGDGIRDVPPGGVDEEQNEVGIAVEQSECATGALRARAAEVIAHALARGHRRVHLRAERNRHAAVVERAGGADQALAGHPGVWSAPRGLRNGARIQVEIAIAARKGDQ
jgi:hypothetical protein